MKGMRSAMKSCSMGKTTEALTEPWMAQRMTTVVAKPRSGEMRPVVMMIVMSTRTRRSWLGLGLELGLGLGLGLGAAARCASGWGVHCRGQVGG